MKGKEGGDKKKQIYTTKKSGSENEMNGNVKEGKWKIGIATATIAVAALMVTASAAAVQTAGDGNAEGGGINETAFWAFVTIALTVVVSVIITSIFHYLSTRELRKMGTEIAVEKPFLMWGSAPRPRKPCKGL